MSTPMTVAVRQEELFAEKRLIQLGVVRIRRQVVTETRTIEVVVRREAVTVERLPIEASGGNAWAEPVTDQIDPHLAEQLRALQLGETLVLPVVEEEVIVHKRPMVMQELVIDKRLVEDVRKLSGTVRREEAESVRLRSGVVSEQQSMVVRVEHEETTVEQVPVEPRPADRPLDSGDSIVDIPQYGEQVSLRKRPVVTEGTAERSGTYGAWNGQPGWTL